MLLELIKFISFFLSISSVFGYTIKSAPLLKTRPNWLKACKASDPNISKCVNDMLYQMFPYLATGIPEINVEHFEPLSLDKVTISKGSGGIVLTGSLFDLNVIGPSNSTPKNTEFTKNGEQGRWNFDLDIPLLDIKSQYNLKGKILVLPLHGQGDCNLKLYNVRTQVTTDTTFPFKENGHQVLHIVNMTVHFKIGSIKVRFDNLFNGNKILGRTVNAFINQNGPDIVNELEESISSSLATIFVKLFNNVFEKIPLSLWYLSDAEYENYQKEINAGK